MGWELKAFGLARNLLITATLTLAGSTAAIHLDAMTPRIRVKTTFGVLMHFLIVILLQAPAGYGRGDRCWSRVGFQIGHRDFDAHTRTIQARHVTRTSLLQTVE